jgi:hypothetical protein
MGGRACKQIGYEVHQNQHLPRAIKNLSPEMFKMDKNGIRIRNHMKSNTCAGNLPLDVRP